MLGLSWPLKSKVTQRLVEAQLDDVVELAWLRFSAQLLRADLCCDLVDLHVDGVQLEAIGRCEHLGAEHELSREALALGRGVERDVVVYGDDVSGEAVARRGHGGNGLAPKRARAQA
jgi:hypothetical protein